MKTFRRILRLVFLLLLIVAAGGVGALLVLTETERGRQSLARIVSDLASTPERKIAVGGINGIWSGALTADHVVVEDAQGPWLVLRGVAVDWSPTALLGMRFEADRVAAQRIELARLPAASSQPSQGGGTTLPVSIDVKAIDLPQIALGKDLAGAGIAELSAKGSFKADADLKAIETDLDIARSDGVPGTAVASIHYAPADNRLELDVKAAEPAGGIIANLLKLPGAPAVDIAVQGKGPLADWAGTGTFSVNGEVVTSLSARRQAVEGGNRIEATGNGTFERFVPERFRPLVEGQTRFDVAGTLTDAGGVAIERASFDSETLGATGSGTADPAGATDLSVDVTAKGPPLVLSLGSEGQPVTVAAKGLSLRAFGDGREPQVDIAASLVSVVAGGTSLRELEATIHSDGFDIANRSGPVKVGLAAGSLETDVATLAPLAAGRVVADLAGSVSPAQLVLDEGTLRSDTLNASLNATLALADMSMTLTMKADAASTALPEALRLPLADRVQFSATASRDPKGVFAANALELTSGSLSVSGVARAEGTDIDADLKGTLGDISVLSKDLSGAVAFALTARGARTAPDFTLDVESDRIAAAGKDLTGLKLNARGKADIAEPAAEVSVAGTLASQPLRAKASLATVDGRRSVKGLAVALGDSTVAGDLDLDENYVPLGTLTVAMPDLARLAALADQAVTGDLKGTVGFSKQGDIPSLTVDLASGSVARDDLTLKTLALKATVTNYAAAPAVSGSVTADALTAGSTEVRAIKVDLAQEGDWTNFQGAAEVAGIPAQAKGRFTVADGTTTVELHAGDATVQGIRATIDGTGRVIVANGLTTLDSLALEVAGGKIGLSGTAGATLDIGVDIAGLPASIGNGFAPGLDAAGTLSGTARLTGPASDPSVRFDLRLADAETAQTRLAGVGPLALAATGTYAAATGLALEKATLSGDSISGTAAGTLNPRGASDFALDLASTGPSLPVSLGSAESPIGLEIRKLSLKAAGEAARARLDLSAVLPTVATNEARIEGLELSLHSDAFDIERRVGPVSGTAAAQAIALDNATAAPLIAGRVTARLAGSLAEDALVVDSGTLASDALQGTFGGRVSLRDGAIALNVKADVASAALPAAARPVLGERVALAVDLKRDASGNIGAEELNLASGPLSAAGSAALADGQLNADIKGALNDISLLSKDAQGSIGFTVKAEGPSAAPDLALNVTSSRLTVAGREITGLSLDASGKADMANPAATVALTGTVAGQPLKGSAVLKTEGGQRRVDNLSLSLGPNGISGSLLLDEAFLPVGSIDLDLPDIGPLAALALEKAEGDVRGTIRFSKDGAVPQLAVTATTGVITRGDLQARDVSVDAVVRDYAAAPVVSGKVKAGSVRSGDTLVSGIDVDLTRDGDWTGFSGGATVKDIPARAKGRVKVAGGTTTVELASGEATVQGIKASIARPSTVTIANGTTRLDRLALALGSGTATVNGTVGEALALDVALSQVPLSLANGFSPGLDAAGSVTGTAKVTGAAASPNVAFTLNASGVQTSQTRGAGIGGLAIASSGSFANNRLTFDATASEGSGIGLKGGGTVTTAGQPTLDLAFSGRVPFGFLSQRLAQQGLSLDGTADVNLTVRGPASAPVIAGTVKTAGARFIDAGSGLAVNDIAADVSIANGVATVNRLDGTLSPRGRLTVGGTVGIDPAAGLPADLTVRLVDGRYTDGQIVTANLGGDLTVKGPLTNGPVIAGTVNLARTVITVPEKLPASLAELDVKHRNAPAAVIRQDKALRPARAGGGGGGGGLNLDVTINAPNQIFIQGRGVDAELGGSLKLTGPASSPQAVGTFTLVRGRLSILGKRLTFTEGSLGFSGSLVPTINLTAESTASDATVTIQVTGEATNPKFTFSSVPALPEDEVLARLIFGRSMSNLSPLQIAQLAEAAGQLAGVGGSTSLLENLRSAIGVDDLDVTTDESGGTAVSAGKYLNDRTYVTIQKGEKPGSGKATIDLDVGRGVKLRGEANDAGEARGGIFYEKEY